MASRRKGRILAFQALYAWDISGALPEGNPTEVVSSQGNSAPEPPESLDQNETFENDDFARLLVTGVMENIAEIDATIRRHLEHWDFSRLNRVDLAILRLSVFSLLYQADTAPSIVINEAIGISREFGTDDSYRFINGVLDTVRKNLDREKPESREAASPQKQ